MVQGVKDPVLSLQWLGVAAVVWVGFPHPGFYTCHRYSQKKEKKKKKAQKTKQTKHYILLELWLSQRQIYSNKNTRPMIV